MVNGTFAREGEETMRALADAEDGRNFQERTYPFELASIAPQFRRPCRCSFTSRRSVNTFAFRAELAHG